MLASAFGFWIAASTLLVNAVDTVMLIRTGSGPPTYRVLGGNGPVRSRADRIREEAEGYQGILGVAGLVVGAIAAHLIWGP